MLWSDICAYLQWPDSSKSIKTFTVSKVRESYPKRTQYHYILSTPKTNKQNNNKNKQTKTSIYYTSSSSQSLTAPRELSTAKENNSILSTDTDSLG